MMWVLLGISALVFVALGHYWGRATTHQHLFFVGGRQFGIGLITASLLAANIGAGTTVGAAGLGYQYGWMAWWWGGSAAVGTLLLTFFIAPKLWRLAKTHQFLTLGDYLAFQYGSLLRDALAWILLLATLFLLAGQLMALSYLFSVFLQVSKIQGCLLSSLIVIGYCAKGGLFATARINALQLVVIFLGFILAAYFLKQQTDISTLFHMQQSLHQNTPPALIFSWLVLLVPAFMISPGLIQKMYAAQNLRSLYCGGVLAALLMALFTLLPVFLGMSAWIDSIVPQQAEWALLQSVADNVPQWLSILLLLAIAFAELSTCDAIILMASSSLSVDLLSRYPWYQARSASQILHLNRALIILMMLIATLLAMYLSSIIAALSLFYTLMVVGLFMPVVTGLYGFKIEQKTMLIIVISSLTGTLLFHCLTNGHGWSWLSPQLFGLLLSTFLVWGRFYTKQMSLAVLLIISGSNSHALTQIPGILVGHCAVSDRTSGATAIVFPDGVIAGVDVRGGGPGTRETDLINPINKERKINSIVLSGGSAFGLDAATGVVQFLAEKNIGYDVGVTKVPLVPAAILFDLQIGAPHIYPDKACGYRAAKSATDAPVTMGNIGAGLGASVGKIRGIAYAMKSGLGVAHIELDNGLQVAALVAVNALGDVINPSTQKVLAGTRADDGKTLLDARSWIKRHPLTQQQDNNTTIGVIATNAVLSMPQATKLAQMGHDGLARSIAPIHTEHDGDTLFAVSTGTWSGDIDMTVIGELAAQMVAQAVVDGTCAATAIKGYPAATCE